MKTIPHCLISLALFGVVLLAAPTARSTSLYSTDFADGAAAWNVNGGTFGMEDGVYRSRAVTEKTKLSRTVVGEKTWSDYRVTARMKLGQTAHNRADYGIVARYQDPNNYYIFLYKVEAKKFTIETKIKGKLKTVAEAPFELDAASWHEFQVTVVGENLSVTVDGKPVMQVTDAEFTAGPAGLLSYWADVACNRFEVASVVGP